LERDAVVARLQFLSFVASELKVSISRGTLESAWSAMRSATARETLLLWMPSALPALSPEALSFGYIELLLKELRCRAAVARSLTTPTALPTR